MDARLTTAPWVARRRRRAVQHRIRPDPPQLGIQDAPRRLSVAAPDRAGEGRLRTWSSLPGRRCTVVARRQGEAPRRLLQHGKRRLLIRPERELRLLTGAEGDAVPLPRVPGY